MVSLCCTSQEILRFFVRGLPFGRPSWFFQGPVSFSYLAELELVFVAVVLGWGWLVFCQSPTCFGHVGLKAGTHERACSCNSLPQHAPGAKLPRLYQRFHAKKKLVKYEEASSRSKSVARACCRSKLPRVYRPLEILRFLCENTRGI